MPRAERLAWRIALLIRSHSVIGCASPASETSKISIEAIEIRSLTTTL